MEHDYEVLLTGVAGGDEKAFRRLWDIYYQKLFHVALFFLRSRELSEEVVSDVFFILWQKRTMLPDIGNLDKYLYVAVKNQSLQYLKKSVLQDKEAIDLYSVEFFHEENDPELQFLDSEFQLLVQQAINSLPDKCKEVFRLHFSDKLKQREIGIILDISEKTVGIHIMNAYKRIAQSVNQVYSEDEKTKRMVCFFF